MKKNTVCKNAPALVNTFTLEMCRCGRYCLHAAWVLLRHASVNLLWYDVTTSSIQWRSKFGEVQYRLIYKWTTIVQLLPL